MGKKSKKGEHHEPQHVHHKAGEGTHHHHKIHDGPRYNLHHHRNDNNKKDEQKDQHAEHLRHQQQEQRRQPELHETETIKSPAVTMNDVSMAEELGFEVLEKITDVETSTGESNAPADVIVSAPGPVLADEKVPITIGDRSLVLPMGAPDDRKKESLPLTQERGLLLPVSSVQQDGKRIETDDNDEKRKKTDDHHKNNTKNQPNQLYGTYWRRFLFSSSSLSNRLIVGPISLLMMVAASSTSSLVLRLVADYSATNNITTEDHRHVLQDGLFSGSYDESFFGFTTSNIVSWEFYCSWWFSSRGLHNNNHIRNGFGFGAYVAQ